MVVGWRTIAPHAVMAERDMAVLYGHQVDAFTQAAADFAAACVAADAGPARSATPSHRWTPGVLNETGVGQRGWLHTPPAAQAAWEQRRRAPVEDQCGQALRLWIEYTISEAKDETPGPSPRETAGNQVSGLVPMSLDEWLKLMT